MTALTKFNLNTNSLSGSIPTEIVQCTKLTELGLEENMLTGNIPSAISALTGLTKITLGQNKLTGGLPASLFTMTKLTEVDLDRNKLSGGIDSAINGLINCANLELNDNSFSGSIPSTIYGMSNITTLYLGHNHLSGDISPSIGDMTKLMDIQLGSNHFTGTIPTTINKLTLLRQFDVAENSLSGGLPKSFNSTNLLNVELGGNFFTGSIPDEMLIPSLTKLTLEDNALTGAVPSSISVMTNLQGLYLDHNSLSGQIPYSMNSMTNLKTLSLYQNAFSGAFALCNLVESATAVNIVNNNFNCWSNCWKGEAALVYDDGNADTNEIPNCEHCPMGQYSEADNINATTPAAGQVIQCKSCEIGKYSYEVGAQSEHVCAPCPNYGGNHFQQVNKQCIGDISLSDNVYVGGSIFDAVAFCMSFLFGLLGFGIFGIFVHRTRNSSKFVVQFTMFPVVMKMAIYGFCVISELTIALALIGSIEWLKFGVIILLFRCFHVLISGYILISTYHVTAKVAEDATKGLVLAKYQALIDAETLYAPDNTGTYNLLSFLCILECQLIQLLPWTYSRSTMDNNGYPDSNTYVALNGFKFLQQCVTMITMMTFLGDSDNNTHGDGLTAIFALNIMCSMAMIFYIFLVEPLFCTLTAEPEGVPSDSVEGPVVASRASVFVETGAVFGGGVGEDDSGIRHFNPMVQPENSSTNEKKGPTPPPSKARSGNSKAPSAPAPKKYTPPSAGGGDNKPAPPGPPGSKEGHKPPPPPM